jgi:hypothetical protein
MCKSLKRPKIWDGGSKFYQKTPMKLKEVLQKKKLVRPAFVKF